MFSLQLLFKCLSLELSVVLLLIKEHCLLGIKGTVRRSTDGHIIHANIDTDVIIAEEPPYGQFYLPVWPFKFQLL